jgi:hypothetical protein
MTRLIPRFQKKKFTSIKLPDINVLLKEMCEFCANLSDSINVQINLESILFAFGLSTNYLLNLLVESGRSTIKWTKKNLYSKNGCRLPCTWQKG